MVYMERKSKTLTKEHQRSAVLCRRTEGRHSHSHAI